MINLLYGAYQSARDAAWQCLIDYKITALPVPLKPITEQAGIKVIADSSVHLLSPGERGRAEMIGHDWLIIVNDEDSPAARRYTIAHELGHIFLGHDVRKGYTGHVRSYRFVVKPQTESEADVFAARLLCPAVILWAMDLHTAAEIAAACNVTMSCAHIRAERMAELYRRGKFLTSPLERQVYENFQGFIETHRA